MAHSFFRKLLRRTTSHSAVPFRPRVEGLEERWVLATVHWINPAGGFWADAAGWSTGAVPGPDDDVVLDAPSNPAVIHSAGDDAVHSLAGADTLILSGGSLRLAAAATFDGGLDLAGGTLGVATRLTVNGSLLWTAGTLTGYSVVANGGLAITGPDMKVLNAELDNTQAGILSGSTLVLQNGGLVNMATGTLEVWGSGVETNDMPLGDPSGFGNDGWVLIYDGTGFGGSFSNSGVIEVVRGGLRFGGPRQVVTNTGTIEVDSGDLGANADYFDDPGTITAAGNVWINAIDGINLAGATTAGGDMTIIAAGFSDLSGPGFSAGGTLVLGAANIGISNTTVHAGAIEMQTDDLGAFIGDSRISVDTSFRVAGAFFGSVFRFGHSTVETPSLFNSAELELWDSSTLVADTVVNEGEFTADAASVFTIRNITNDGYLAIAGSISDNLVNAGELAIGGFDGTGQLNVGGDYTQTPTGRLDLNIAGTDQYSQLNVGGTAYLDGTLAVTALNTLTEGDTFQAMTFANVVGNFARYNMPNLDAGLFLDAVLDDGGLTLVVRRQD